MGSGVSSLTRRPVRETGSARADIEVFPQVQPTYLVQGSTSPHLSAVASSGPSSGQRFVRPAEEGLYNGNDDLTDRLLGSGHVQATPGPEPMYTGRSNQSDGAAVAEMFTHTAMSLGMDNEDLLFNLMYFGEGQTSTFGAVMEGVQQETLALHSENNTPYKLKPASVNAVRGLHGKIFGEDLISEECECQVCKDNIEMETAVLQIPSCQHFFHEECLLRWSKLQGWCPVCRAPIEAEASSRDMPNGAETMPEESPSNQYDNVMGETVPLTDCNRGPSLRLFDGEDEVVLSRGGHVEVQAGRSPRLGPDITKPPGSQKCVV